ncbi:MAG: hypothetical protein IJL56_09375 [Bacteroidales bacterium]|nr:hypothetical protein [Bacteroidales bacterium]
MRSRHLISVLALAAVLSVGSCDKPEPFSMDRSAPSRVPDEYHHFTTSMSYEHVVLLYQAGFNSLSSYLEQNIKDLYKGDLPNNSQDVLLLLSHLPERAGRYSVQTSPALLRIGRDYKGSIQVDTLVVYPKTTVSSSAKTVHDVLTFVQERFPSESYGLVLCSHASGWLPVHYYSEPSYYEEGNIWTSSASPRSFGDLPAPPYRDLPAEGTFPAVRSFGQDRVLAGARDVSWEIDIADLAEAIPMHMDYILFDACLMGCVEVAYQLRDVCDKVGFSPAEVLAEGFVYDKLPGRLLSGDDPDPEGVLKDFFDKYDAMDGNNRSATISMVDCSKLERLASVCSTLVSKYRPEILSLDPSKVQGYFRYGRNYFYDLQDIFVQAGIDASDAAALASALDDAVVYKEATPSFIDSFQIRAYSGLSMYLPSIEYKYPDRNYTYLNRYYRESVAWNTAIGLVR